ncbi:hypothetical protein OROGR_021197 [Orobanche gracilis]
MASSSASPPHSVGSLDLSTVMSTCNIELFDDLKKEPLAVDYSNQVLVRVSPNLLDDVVF